MNQPSRARKDAKLNIGFVFDDSLDSNDGVAQYVKTLGEWFYLNGHNVSYLVGETKTKKLASGRIYSLSKNIPVNFNNNRLTIPLPAKKAPIKKLVNQGDFDVIHVQVPYSPFMAKHVILTADKETAVIGTFHILPADRIAMWGAKGLGVILSRSLKRFDKVVSVSQAAADFAKQAFGINTKVIPNVIDIERFKVKKTANNQFNIVFLGRLVERKGCLELLKAFKLLLQSQPNCKLTIAGTGPDKNKLYKYVKSRKMSENVEFLGFIDEAAKPALLANADIACFPSIGGESFGIVLLEAMAAGSGLVIGGDNPGYRSVLGGKPQLLFDPKNTQEFASKLESLIVDEDKRRKLHDWQSLQIMQYDVSVVGPKILNIYQSAIAKRAKISA